MQMKPLRAPKEPTRQELLAAKRAFPPNFLHETWRDYLYWDVALGWIATKPVFTRPAALPALPAA